MLNLQMNCEWFCETQNPIRSAMYTASVLYHFNQFDSHTSQPSVFCRKLVVVTCHIDQCRIDPMCDTAGSGQIWL